MKKLFIILGLFAGLSSFAQQANVSYETNLENVFSREGDDCWEVGEEEYSAELFINGVENCRTCNNNGDCNYGGNSNMLFRSNVAENAWNMYWYIYEDDGGDRCDYNGGDDCLWNSSQNYNFVNVQYPSAYTAYTRFINVSNSYHNFQARGAWRYTNGGSALNQPVCQVQSTGYGSGGVFSWRVSLTAGRTYNFNNCGSAGDTYLRIYGTDGYTIVALNDDGCGTASTVNYSPGTSGTYYVEVSQYSRGTLGSAGTLYYSEVTSVSGDPAAFGNNVWNVYAYCGNSIDLSGVIYGGYYTESALSFNTINRWCSDCSPSSASGFSGRVISADYHSVASKRQGFPCGIYSLSMPNNDDDVRVYINGGLVTSGVCCNTLTGTFWTGYLGTSSTIEVRHAEGVGGSNHSLTLSLVTSAVSGGTIGGITNGTIVCSGGDPGAFTNAASASGGTIGITNGVPPAATYQWESSTTSATAGFGNIAAQTGATYDPASVSGTTWFRRKITDACGTVAYSNVIQVVTVSSPNAPSATASPAGAQACAGYPLSLGSPVYGTEAGRSCGFEYSINGGAWDATAVIPSPAAGTHSIAVRVKGACVSGCNASPATTYTWAVAAQPVAQSITANIANGSTVCRGQDISATFAGGNGGAGTVADEYGYSTNAGSNWAAYTPGSAISTSGIVGTDIVQIRTRRTSTASGCNTSAYTIYRWTVVANPSVTISEVHNDLIGCSGDTFAFVALPSGGFGISGLQWQKNVSGSWINVGGNSTTYNTGVLANTGGGDIVTGFRVLYTTAGCGSTTSAQVNITIHPKPTAEPEFDDCAAQLAGTKYSYIILSNSGSAPPFHVNDSTNLGAVKMYSDVDTSYLIYRLPQDGSNTEYVFTTTDANGCSVTSTFMRETTYPNTIVTANTSGTTVNECQLRGWNEWEHFQNPNNKDEVIMSVNPKGVDLGKVTVSSYVDAPGISVMNSGSTCTGTAQAAMRRHYKVTSSAFAPGEAFTNGANVGVRLYFSNADFADLSNRAAANDDANNSCTTDDNITDMAELFVTKYSDNTGSGTENGTYADNDPAMGIYKVFGPGRPNSAATYAGPVSAMQSNGFDAVFQPQTATGHHYIDLDVTEFSEFWLHGSGSGSPLPVKMLFIEAKGVDNTFIRTSWATSTEIDNWKFEVERSEDGKTFTKIGEVIGHATTTERQDYLYNDLTTRQGVRYYYRLKQIDFDGKYEYTPIVSAILDIDDAFSVGEFVPNPTSGRSTLIFKTKANKEVKAQVVNYLGAVVMEQTKTIRNADNTMYFDFDKLAAGTYMVRISTIDNIYSKRIVLTR